jgi:hypothetical protein
MKQTAVEWLEDNLLSEPWTEEDFKYNAECWEKAKEMEEEQIIKATLYGFRQDSDGDDWEGDNYNAEKYYNQTFKQEQ